jgi:predicted nucleic acid-binding protein
MTFDTNIVIAYLSGEASVLKQATIWREQGINFFLPIIAEAEVLSFSALTAEDIVRAERFLAENFISIPMDRSMARETANIRRRYRLKLPDASIAATALTTQTQLVTRDLRDFRRVPKLHLLTI